MLGYIVMAIFVMTGLTVAWYLMGPERAFKSDALEVSFAWLAINLPLSFAAAMLGGWVASTVGKHPRNFPVYVLAALVLMLGVVSASMQSSVGRPSPPPSLEELTTTEAAQFAVQPTWYGLLMPCLGAAGIILGGLVAHRATEYRGRPDSTAGA